MTTASSLPFATMEVPAVEDSMEMASPYQGQGDDFDIDIDIMDDQGSHMDSDMMGADDYPTSQPSLFPNEANNDADMVDEPSEGSMVDADEYVDEDHDIEVQDEEVTYEAEMQEGDQDVNVEAPEIPTIQVEAAGDEKAINESVQPLTEPAERSESQDESGVPAQPTSGVSQPGESEDQAQAVSAEFNEAESVGPEQTPVNQGDEPDAAAHQVDLTEEKHEITEGKGPGIEDSQAHAEPASEYLNASQVDSDRHKGSNEHAEHDSRNLHESEDQDHQNDEGLHPVKVLYQDSEISLFPPLEGDSAETFFLHDEDVAYDSVGKLFSSLREVLLDNVAENEVLTIDIDSLGIQITEDSSYTSKVTLHQIVDIYLRLCHNDGTNEPEALYLTLSSKLAVDAELAALAAAAGEGKGLSQVLTWDDYDNEVSAEDKAADAQEAPRPDEEALAEETEPDHPVPELHEGATVQEVADECHDADDAKEAQEEAVPEHAVVGHQAEAEAESDTERVSEVQHEEEGVTQEYDQTNEAQSAHDDDGFEERYDSEAHHTESSATIANEHAEDTHGYDVGAEGNHGTDDQVGEDFDQEQVEADEPDGLDALQDESSHEEGLVEENPDSDEIPHDSESFHKAEAPSETENAPAEDSTGDVDDVPYDQTESTLQNAPQQDVADSDRTPEAEDDNLGIAEDLMQAPAKDLSNDQHEYIEGVDEEQHEEDQGPNQGELATPPAEQHDGNDFDDYYPPPDLEVTEAIELGGTDAPGTDPHTHDNFSTKRSREEDEEWDIAATTTPDTKRRRS